jgi:hypothetical protein
MTNTTDFALSDHVIARIVQIIQEGFLLGIDVTDLMRQIRVEPDGGQLVLTAAYKAQVKEMQERLAKQAAQQSRVGVPGSAIITA